MGNTFLLGIASYGFITANYLFVLSYCKENEMQKLRAINILSTTSNIGLGLTAMIISTIYSFGFQNIFLITSCILFILAYLSFIISNQNNLPENNLINDSNQLSIENLELPLNKKNNQITALILVSVFFVGLIVAQLSTTYSAYIRETYPELGVKAVTSLFALNSFIVVVLSTPLGDCIKKFNKIMIIGIGGFLIGFGMFMLTFSGPFILAIFACIAYTIGEIIFFSMTQLVCYQNSLKNQKGKNLGFYRMIYASSRVTGPAMGGIVYTKFGGRIIWLMSGIIGLLCLISGWLFRKRN